MIEVLLAYASLFVGTPYYWGGNGAGGFDCSGYVIECLRSADAWSYGDATSQSIYKMLLKKGAQVIDDPAPGAILFFGESRFGITHIAIAIDGRFMYEAGGGNEHTKTAKAAKELGAMVRRRPIKNRKDLVACLLPNYN